jgi:hypothetical protein
MVQEDKGVTCNNPKCADRGKLYLVSVKLTAVRLTRQ